MNRGLSLYLDLTRFTAAMIVFLGHARGQSFTGGLFWQLAPYMQTAVIVFFVLSGYVIAHVLNGRENSAREYAAARIARLYSVVIPALFITAICDGIGSRIDPAFYYDGPWWYPPEGEAPMRYVATLLFINRFWTASLEPGINGPFWSLSFEAVYYILAGLMFFMRGWIRMLSIAAVALAAGPTIMALAPIWFVGYGIYHLAKRITVPFSVGLACVLAGLAMLIGGPVLRDYTMPFEPRLGPELITGYYEAAGFALHLFGVHYIARTFGFLNRFTGLIRWAASLTFALYLFHRPLIQLFAVLDIGPPDSWQQRAYLLGMTLLVVATVGWWCERQKGTLRRLLTRTTSKPVSRTV